MVKIFRYICTSVRCSKDPSRMNSTNARRFESEKRLDSCPECGNAIKVLGGKRQFLGRKNVELLSETKKDYGFGL